MTWIMKRLKIANFLLRDHHSSVWCQTPSLSWFWALPWYCEWQIPQWAAHCHLTSFVMCARRGLMNHQSSPSKKTWQFGRGFSQSSSYGNSAMKPSPAIAHPAHPTHAKTRRKVRLGDRWISDHLSRNDSMNTSFPHFFNPNPNPILTWLVYSSETIFCCFRFGYSSETLCPHPARFPIAQAESARSSNISVTSEIRVAELRVSELTANPV